MDVNLTSCGVTKSCYTDPAGCAAEQCNYIVSWSNQGDWVNFELSTRLASDHKWTALGFSHDLLMVCLKYFNSLFKIFLNYISTL